jgi:hypothetical protein
LPFRDNELGVSHRHALLQNFVKVKKEIKFYVVGNLINVKIFAQVPVSLSSYFRNQFFAAYPTSDLVEYKKELVLPTKWSYVHTDAKADIAAKEFFVLDGSYIDPMKDIMTIFSSIPKD